MSSKLDDIIVGISTGFQEGAISIIRLSGNGCVELVNKCFKGLLLKIGGMNELLMNQPELVTVLSLLQAAMIEYNSPEFDFQTYRKLILDAGAEVNKLKEV